MADWKLVFVFDSNINIIALKLKLSQLKLKMQLAATTNCISKNVSVSSGFAFSPVARVLTYQHLLNDVWLLCDNAILIQIQSAEPIRLPLAYPHLLYLTLLAK